MNEVNYVIRNENGMVSVCLKSGRTVINTYLYNDGSGEITFGQNSREGLLFTFGPPEEAFDEPISRPELTDMD